MYESYDIGENHKAHCITSACGSRLHGMHHSTLLKIISLFFDNRFNIVGVLDVLCARPFRHNKF
jgi:hypothetical protein